MNENLRIILAFSCIMPALLALAFYKRIDRQYYPLIYILLLALVTEIANWITLHNTSSLPVNIYIFINVVLHVWLFYNMRIIKKAVASGLVIFFAMFIAGNVIYNRSVHVFLSPAACVAGIVLLIVSIEGVTKRVFYSNKVWYKDGFFLFCIISIEYNAYFTFTFLLRFFGLKGNDPVVTLVESVHNYVNAVSNILLTWVVLCLIQAKKYTR